MMVYFESVRVSVLLFPFVALLLFVPIWIKQRIRFGELHEYRAGILFAFIFYFIVACLLTVLPLPKDSVQFCEAHGGIARTQFVPFGSFADIGRFAQSHSLGWSPGDIIANLALRQIVFNVLLLLPFGFLLRALYGIKLVPMALVAFGMTLMLETTQLTGVWGLAPCPYRLFDVDDLITNTAGALIGWAMVPLFHWLPDPQLIEDKLWYRRKDKDRNDPD